MANLIKVSAGEAHMNLRDLLNRVHYRGETFIIQRHGRDIAILSPASDPKQPARKNKKESLTAA